MLLTERLIVLQYQVTEFVDPLRFLSCLEEPCCTHSRPCCDVILTDNQMPGMTGLDFLERLKQKGCQIPGYRTAIVSGAWSAEELARTRRLGCRVLPNPTPLEEIQDWLHDCESWS